MGLDTCSIVLRLGKRRVAADDLVDGEEVVASTRTVDALVLDWAIPLDELDDLDEGAHLLVERFGELLRLHRDDRGVLVGRSAALRPLANLSAATYADIVAEIAPSGRWIPNISDEDGATGAALERREIPLPDLPRSRAVELYLLSPARALRELGLTEPPLRVACSDRDTLQPPEAVVAFYAPRLKAGGFTLKRRVWSDGSTEELVGHSPTHQVIVRAERMGEGRTFVRLAWIAKRGALLPAGKTVTLAAEHDEPVAITASATSSKVVLEVPAGMRARILGHREVRVGASPATLRYEVEVAYGTGKRGWVDAAVIRAL